MSDGPLSANFPEVAVTITSSFEHDRGMNSTISSLSVGGAACGGDEILQKVVALRGGWTRSGGKSSADALQTFEHFVEDWSALFEWSGRLLSETTPPNMGMFAETPSRGRDITIPAYHPPRVGLHTLESGQVIVYHAYFRSWDAGNHGQLYDYQVQAYAVSDGARVTVDKYALYEALSSDQ